jgi:hypothetical protein
MVRVCSSQTVAWSVEDLVMGGRAGQYLKVNPDQLRALCIPSARKSQVQAEAQSTEALHRQSAEMPV